MRLFVGTLYSGENELEECINAVNNQSYKDFQHFILRNLPKKQANETLFELFMDKANEFDLLIKVDADMVLTNSSFFANVVKFFKENKSIQVAIIAIQDFFCDQLMIGLAVYRNDVTWPRSSEQLYTEIPPVPVDNMIIDFTILAPAAIHCKNPSEFQAFHYGVHRGLKIIYPSGDPKLIGSAKKHLETIELTWQNYKKKRDRRLALAVLGAELAYRGTFEIKDLDYDRPFLKEYLNKHFSHLSPWQLDIWLQIVRLVNFSFLSRSRRLKYLQNAASTSQHSG